MEEFNQAHQNVLLNPRRLELEEAQLHRLGIDRDGLAKSFDPSAFGNDSICRDKVCQFFGLTQHGPWH